MSVSSPPLPPFVGTAEQQALAAEVFQLMVAQSSFFANDSPISQTLANLAEFLAQKHQDDSEAIATAIDAVLSQNSEIFAREERGSDIIYRTSRQGTHEIRERDTSHLYKRRLYDPEHPLPIDDISVVISTSRPALTTVEPVFVSDYWQDQAEAALSSPRSAPTITNDYEHLTEVIEQHPDDSLPTDDTPPPYTPYEVAPDAPFTESTDIYEALAAHDHDSSDIDVPSPYDVADPDGALAHESFVISESYTPPPPTDSDDDAAVSDDAMPLDDALMVTDEEYVEVIPGDEVALVEPTPIEPPVRDSVLSRRPAEYTTFALSEQLSINLNQPIADLIEQHYHTIEQIFLEQIDRDPLRRIVRFGRMLAAENNLITFGKNDLRRIRDYVNEVGEPLRDTVIIDDLYRTTGRQAYENYCFSLNYRLSREKDFDFVGVDGVYLWSTKDLPAIGTKRIKAAEMGQLTSYLVEGHDDSNQPELLQMIREQGKHKHLLTFFEWVNGILPFNSAMATLLPSPMFPDQRNAILRVESQQHYTNYLVEVRYPTGNRGGWLQGLEEFFREYVIPGAFITLSTTDEPNVLAIDYEENSVIEDRLLSFDEKKKKFAFTDIAYSCTVETDYVLAQSRFGRLKNLKSLPMNERRKADHVLRHVFETVGEQIGSRSAPRYQILLDDLHVAYNVLRPASRSYLRLLLNADELVEMDESLEELYLYQPESEEPDDEEQQADEVVDDIPMSKWESYDEEEYRRRR